MAQTHYPYFTTLEELLKHYESPLELVRRIDDAMLTQVISLHYEPERLKCMIPAYESLWELRNLILNQIKPAHP